MTENERKSVVLSLRGNYVLVEGLTNEEEDALYEGVEKAYHPLEVNATTSKPYKISVPGIPGGDLANCMKALLSEKQFTVFLPQPK